VKRILHLAATVCTATWLAVASPVSAQKAASGGPVKSVPAWYDTIISQRWTGDLDEMVKRRTIRALVVYSLSGYFVDKGTQRGASYEALVGFEEDLNKQLKTKNLRVNVVFIPVKLDDLIPALMDGRGDIAAAFITVTPARDKLIDFSDPLVAPINEVVVSGPTSPDLATLDDLSGKEVFVHKSSSYYEHLQTLNAGLKKAGKPPVKILPASESLQIEDLLQMLNAGLVQFVIADDIKAKLWQQVLPDIKVRPDLVVNSGGAYAWMVREKSPQLLQAINAFIKRHPNSDAGRGEVLRKYLKSTKFIKNSTSPQELQKFDATIELFRKYSGQYSFDTLLMIAQGYQESRLDQQVHSRVGALGVMQVMPDTGRAMGVGNIVDVDPNIHAGVKYIASIRDRYFAGLPMDDLNKTLFSFAAYNAGPNRILSLRGIAEKRGLNPNVWFDNVELIAAEKIGRETVTYVRNIFKYYIAYRLLLDRKTEHDEALKTSAPK
jgi:membrane-bound lytic murein transglycosylase MltF